MSQQSALLRRDGRPLGGALLAIFAVVTVVTGRTINGLVFDEVSPLVAAALASVFGSVALNTYVGRRVLRRLGKAVLAGDGEPVPVVLRDVRQRIQGLGRPMRILIFRLAIGNTFQLPLTLLALDRLTSMGTVGAVVFCGPLGLAVFGLRKLLSDTRSRFSGLLWMLVAAGGVACVTRFWEGDLDGWGLLIAIGAAACYANYLHVLDQMRKVDARGISVGVALGTLLSTALTVTLTVVALTALSATGTFVEGLSLPGDNWANPRVFGITALSGLLSGAVTQIIQNRIFGRGLISLATVSVLTSLEPAASLVLGWAMLSSEAVALDGFGIAAVCVAGFACTYQLEVRGRGRRVATTSDGGGA